MTMSASGTDTPVEPPHRSPRIALAHEWLVTYAGSERVVGELLAAFESPRLLTTMARSGSLPSAFDHAETSFLQRVPGAVDHHEWTLPLMPASWRLRPEIDGVDAVVSSSHACAKAVRIAEGIPHLCYCHTPMRYAWDFAGEQGRFPRPIRPAAQVLMAGFRRWDRATASRVTRFVANSETVADRIRRHYGRQAVVVHPPVDTEYFTPAAATPLSDEFLYVGRLVSYKRADLAVEAFAGSPYRLTVVGDGHLRPGLEARAGSNVRFLGKVDDAELRELYRTSRAMVFPADEDFGISMAEAQACGTPVVSVRRGGALDIVEPGVTGVLARPDDVDDLRAAIDLAARTAWDREAIRTRAQRFSAATFRARMREAVADMVADPVAR
jgi:glycosyltransferase involved in cell wall biosynthesis